VQGMLLAGVTPDNTPHGYNLTFAFPMLMFIIIAGALYLRFLRPHRVPGHVTLASSRSATAPSAEESTPEPAQSAPAEQPDPGSAGAETVMKEIPEGAE